MLLPVAWTLFALACVGGFLMIAAYWLDIGERDDLSRRRRLAWRAGVLGFPVTIPLYAFGGGPGWPLVLRVGAFVPVLALALFFGFLAGAFT
ncbi:MAG: hypothetical protein ABR509_01810 [Candidatus Limnocylindria bacterium]